MTYEIYRYVFIGGAVMSMLMLALAVFLFFSLNIPHVLGDLTGANARKAIEQIRTQNEGTGIKTYKSSHVNKERGRLTDKISASGSLMQPSVSEGAAMRTEKFETELLSQQAYESYSEQNNYHDTVPHVQAGDTILLAGESNGMYGQTSLLGCNEEQALFEVEFEICYIHTDIEIP